MRTYSSIAGAVTALRDYERDHLVNLPAHVRFFVTEAAMELSAVVGIVKFCEVIYANRDVDGMPEDARELAVDLTSFATIPGWHGLANDDRGIGIISALRRDLGHDHPAGISWPDPESDPEKQLRYCKPETSFTM